VPNWWHTRPANSEHHFTDGALLWQQTIKP
jgi:hypothetical protein